MQLSAHLEALTDDELVELLRHRPDLAGAVNGGFGTLAGRAASRASLGRLLLRSDVGMLVAAEALSALGPILVDDLVERVGRADPIGFVEALERLLVRGAAVRDADGRIAAAGQLAELFPHPLGLGRPVASLASHLDVASIRDIAEHLGLRLVATRKAELIDELAAHLGRADVVNDAVADAPDDARELLARMVDARAADLELPSWLLHRWRSTPVDPRVWLVRHGLLLPAPWDRAEMPREVGLVLHGDALVRSFPFHQPPLVTVEGADQGRVDAEAASAAARALGAAEAVLHAVEARPPTLRKDGTLGVRELRKLAKSAGQPDDLVALVVEVLAACGVVTLSASALEADDLAGKWTRLARHERWLVLVRTWTDTDRIPSFALSVGPDGGTRPALEVQHGPFDARSARRDLIEQLARVDAGLAVDFEDAWVNVTWRAPNLWSVPDITPAVTFGWFVREAVTLGLVALDAPTSALRALAAGRLDELREQAVALLPGDQSTFVLQADLTAIALGALAPDVARRLAELADREPAGDAGYRFTEASVRRGFDLGWTATQMRAFLSSHSLAGVPQALDYLIGDVERRYGHLVVHSGTSVVVAVDEATLVEAISNRRTRSLELRQIAPGVAVSPVGPEELIAGLRNAGYLPVGADGTVSIARGEDGEADGGTASLDEDAVLAQLAEDLADEPPTSWFAPTGGRELSDVEAAELVGRLRRGGDPDDAVAPTPVTELRQRVRTLRRRQVRVAFLDGDDYVELIAMLMSADDEWVHLYDPADHQVLSVPYTDLVGLEAIEGPS
ncbi:MAG: helicase-associated domain-containing protein [Acidimicrobiales bacterium]|nr:helicase-associated domain-containing protein [Acidimicrobiales bacterium]